jgi:anti-anti-sigma factor
MGNQLDLSSLGKHQLQSMKIDFEHSQDTLIMVLSGRLDAIHHNFLREKVIERIPEASWKTLLFDLFDLDYVSSAGFREFFLIGHNIQKQGKKMAVCSLKPAVRRIFEIAMFQDAYPVFDSRNSALGS